MIVRLMRHRGEFLFAWFIPADCIDVVEGLPVEVHPRAYRRSIYRDPNVSRDVLNRRFVRIENAPAGPRDGLSNIRVRSVGPGASGEATTLEIEAQTPSQSTSRVASTCGPSDPDGKPRRVLNLQKAAGSTDGPALIRRLRTHGLGRRVQSNFRGTGTKSEARPVSATAHES